MVLMVKNSENLGGATTMKLIKNDYGDLKRRLRRLLNVITAIKGKTITAIFILFFLFNFLNFFSLSNCSYAAVPHLINYQGKLTDSTGKPVVDNTYAVTFKIYDNSAGNSSLWSETQSVLVQKGIFSVMLGGVTPFPSTLTFDKQYYLGIQVGQDAQMSPLQQLTSCGYAFMADNAMSVPKGIITMWSGSIATIPPGWALCDGTNGTPDLRNRFIVGAGSSYAVGATGGEATHTLTINEMPAHTHTYAKETGASCNIGGSNTPASQQISTATSSTGAGQSHENRPPYYALAYIMKL